MRIINKLVIVLASAFIVSSCTTMRPAFFAEAAIAHQTFPSLSVMVGMCVADRPDIENLIRDDFNTLVDKWELVKDVDAKELLVKVVNAKTHVVESKVAWINIRATIVNAGIDCGDAVASMVLKIESLFKELETAILQNQRAVYVLEYGSLLASIISGRNYEVKRL